MTLRVVFMREDLQRVRIADQPDLMWELVQSLHQVQERVPAPHYATWHRECSPGAPLRRGSANSQEATGAHWPIWRRHCTAPTNSSSVHSGHTCGRMSWPSAPADSACSPGMASARH